MNHCLHCQEKENKYRVLQADLQFQIKKMREDLANERVTLELHYQKEYKKVIEKYSRQKLEREQENKKWIQKYDQIVQQYQAKLLHLSKEHQKSQKEFELSLANQYKKNNKQIIDNYDSKISHLQRSHSQSIQQLQVNFSADFERAKRQNQEDLSKLKQQHQRQLTKVVEDYDCKIHKLKQQVRLNLQAIGKLKLDAQQKQTSLYQELYHRKQEINDLKYNADQLQTNIKMLSEQIRLKNVQIQVIKQQHQQQINGLRHSFSNQKESLISQFSQQIQTILKKKLDDCQKYEQVVKDIEVKRQNQIKIYQTNLKEVKQFVEERPSRDQDIEQILVLKELLNQKQKQCQKAFNDAKGYRLQLNNKQEVFNKIFCAQTSPLNIQKLGKRRDTKNARASSSNIKDMSKYQSINTFHAPTTTDLAKRQKLALQPKSTKYF